MKMIKMALLGGAAMAVTAASAKADDLEALKAQIDSLNTRIAAMETAPSVPTGYQLIAISEGDLDSTPGLGFTARERAAYGNKGTVISVLPTADAPAGTTITWSGYARAGLVYGSTDTSYTAKLYDSEGNPIDSVELENDEDDQNDNEIINFPYTVGGDDDDIDVKARGQIRVKASTDTAVGEVGVDIRLRGNFNGNGDADVYSDVAWGYWAMTPELTFGGGYYGSLGNIGYGYDGACTCYYTDNADLGFNPNDTTQMRLSYASGPFSMAVALEDAGIRKPGFGASDGINGDQLGAAGEIKYSGDIFSGEIAGVWRSLNEDDFSYSDGFQYAENSWQIGAGFGFGLGDIANLSIAAAMGEGPFTVSEEGVIIGGLPYNQSWWGVTALASMSLSDEFSAEIGVGYKNREGDEFGYNALETTWDSNGVDYETWGVLGGLYYNPVDQLTLGIEAEYYTTSIDVTLDERVEEDARVLEIEDGGADTFSIDFVSVWRF